MKKEDLIQEAISEMNEEQAKADNDLTKQKIKNLVGRINDLSHQLREAKKELVELNYDPPTEITNPLID